VQQAGPKAVSSRVLQSAFEVHDTAPGSLWKASDPEVGHVRPITGDITSSACSTGSVVGCASVAFTGEGVGISILSNSEAAATGVNDSSETGADVTAGRSVIDSLSTTGPGGPFRSTARGANGNLELEDFPSIVFIPMSSFEPFRSRVAPRFSAPRIIAEVREIIETSRKRVLILAMNWFMPQLDSSIFHTVASVVCVNVCQTNSQSYNMIRVAQPLQSCVHKNGTSNKNTPSIF
jgi:hypothetical protein